MTSEHKWWFVLNRIDMGYHLLKCLLNVCFAGEGGHAITKGTLYLQIVNRTSKAGSTRYGTHQPNSVRSMSERRRQKEKNFKLQQICNL